MLKKCSFKVCLFGIALFALLALVGVVASRPAAGAPFTSPLPTPSLLPASPFDSPLSPPVLEAQARIALRYIAKRESVPLDDLLVAHRHRREYPLLGRQFMAFTIFDRTARRDFHLLVDLDDGSVVNDVAAVERAEAGARRAKYGRLHPTLYERLQTAGEEETLARGPTCRNLLLAQIIHQSPRKGSPIGDTSHHWMWNRARSEARGAQLLRYARAL